MQKIAALYDASQAVIATFDLDEVLNQIVAIVRDYFHLQHVAILLLDPDTRLLKLRTHHGWEKTGEPTEVAFGQGLIGAAAQSKRPVHVPDVSRDARYLRGIDSTRSELAMPLLVRGEVAGVLDCQSEKLGFFDEESINLLTLFSTQASIAMENARLYSLEQRKARQLEAINAIARQTTAVLELHELLETACAHILQSFAVDHVAMLVREEHALVLRAHQGRLTTRFPVGVQLTPGAGLCARALESGKPVVENDVNAVPGYIAGFVETRSEMCLPMICFGQIVGVLALESAQPGAFQTSDVQPLESVADICANAIQNARYFDRMRQMAYVDGLTGIFNRRYFELRIRQEIERVQRYQGSLSIIMIDLDQFKSINDEFGHLLGDEVLRQVCGIFSQQLRRVDVACRYGGEEFAILAPETSGEAALALAEKLRRTVETWSFTGVPRPVTISAGVATLSLAHATRDELVRAADAALYAAKQAGRNRVLPAAPGSFVKA